MSRRTILFCLLSLTLALGIVAMTVYASSSYQHRAEVYGLVYHTIGIGRQTFHDRVEVIDPSLYIVPVGDQGKYKQVGENTQLGVLTVRLLNRSDAPVHLRVMEELRLVDSQGRVYAPSWVSYNDNTRKLITTVTTGEIDVNTYNPGVSQYRYVVFLLPSGSDTYKIVSTDYSFQRDLLITGATPTVTPPQVVPTPPTKG